MELKPNPKLRPNWVFVARRVGYSVEQCKARWKELQDLQRLQDTKPPELTPPTDPMTPPPEPLPPTPTHISPTPTSPANTPPQPSQPDFSPHQRQPLCLHTKTCHRRRLLSERPVRTGIRNHLRTCLLAAISCDQFHPFSTARHRINSTAPLLIFLLAFSTCSQYALSSLVYFSLCPCKPQHSNHLFCRLTPCLCDTHCVFMTGSLQSHSIYETFSLPIFTHGLLP